MPRMEMNMSLNCPMALNLTFGASFWTIMYLVYISGQPRWLIVISQAFHGLAYVFFMIVGQIFAGRVGPHIPASMQALIFAATTGVGMFFGTQLAGSVMDRYSVEGQFQWRKIWAVPMVIMAVGALVLATAFRAEVPPAEAEQAAAVQIEQLAESAG